MKDLRRRQGADWRRGKGGKRLDERKEGETGERGKEGKRKRENWTGLERDNEGGKGERSDDLEMEGETERERERRAELSGGMEAQIERH